MPARLPKLPFYLADLVLSAIVVFVLYRLGSFEGTWEFAVVTVGLAVAALGAWISILPWLADHKAAVKLADSGNLASSFEQIQGVEKVAEQIAYASSQWQGVQESSTRTINAAKEISERMKAEAEDFMKFIQNAHDQERSHLRLEVEKLKRAEGDWLKVLVQIMDHVHALTQAGVKSGQPGLVNQLQQFQNACRDVARRIGLVPYVPTLGEPYDERGHQLPDPKFQPPEGSKVGDVLATGFMYQGQLLRRSLVLLANPEEANPAGEAEESGFAEVEQLVSGPKTEREEPSPDEENPRREAPSAPEIQTETPEQTGWDEGETKEPKPPQAPPPSESQDLPGSGPGEKAQSAESQTPPESTAQQPGTDSEMESTGPKPKARRAEKPDAQLRLV